MGLLLHRFRSRGVIAPISTGSDAELHAQSGSMVCRGNLQTWESAFCQLAEPVVADSNGLLQEQGAVAHDSTDSWEAGFQSKRQGVRSLCLQDAGIFASPSEESLRERV